MLSTLHVQEFRGFKSFELNRLGRINLLVGSNNSGKTSILEAIYLLLSAGNTGALVDTVLRRGETAFNFSKSRQGRSPEVPDLSHLFYGRLLSEGSSFRIKASDRYGGASLRCDIQGLSDQEMIEYAQKRLFRMRPSPDDEDEFLASQLLELRSEWISNTGNAGATLLINDDGVLVEDTRPRRLDRSQETPSSLVSTAGMSPLEVTGRLDNIVLTDEEDVVVEALRTIEPRIDRIARVGNDAGRYSRPSRGGVLAKLRDEPRPIPLGSMGDGVWRLLGLILGVTSSARGVVLIDEIDTGLHHTVMDAMWRILDVSTKRLGVQVFATTHSRDAYESLATIAEHSDSSEVMIHRIDNAGEQAVPFNTEEIVAAAKRGLEVR